MASSAPTRLHLVVVHVLVERDVVLAHVGDHLPHCGDIAPVGYALEQGKVVAESRMNRIAGGVLDLHSLFDDDIHVLHGFLLHADAAKELDDRYM